MRGHRIPTLSTNFESFEFYHYPYGIIFTNAYHSCQLEFATAFEKVSSFTFARLNATKHHLKEITPTIYGSHLVGTFDSY